MTNAESPTYYLRKISSIEWVIADRNISASQLNRIVARIYQQDRDEYEVEWLRDLPLMAHYHSPEAALDDARQHGARLASQRPHRIVHRAAVA